MVQVPLCAKAAYEQSGPGTVAMVLTTKGTKLLASDHKPNGRWMEWLEQERSKLRRWNIKDRGAATQDSDDSMDRQSAKRARIGTVLEQHTLLRTLFRRDSHHLFVLKQIVTRFGDTFRRSLRINKKWGRSSWLSERYLWLS